MKWSYRIARISGIDVRIHTTFLLLLAWVAYSYYQAGGLPAAMLGVAFICLLFLCVLLHEFGHAFAARAFGIRTPDITLLPIGGVARLERMPDRPMQEFIVAVAGPAVNVGIVLILWMVLGLPSLWRDYTDFDNVGSGLLGQLMAVNVMLILFNMIPAFPMDGGRVLRSLLATKLDYAKATMIAARVGQGIALLFVLAGFFLEPFNPFLILIAVFVFSGAQQELVFANARAAASGLRVSDAMLTQFRTLPRNISIADAAAECRDDTQPIYPVTDAMLRVVGMVERNAILSAAPDTAKNDPILSVTQPSPVVAVNASFEDAFLLMQQNQIAVLPVVNPGGQVVGLVSLNLMAERSRARR